MSHEFRDNFFIPEVWDDKSKAAYAAWLSRMTDDHPAKRDPTPWSRPPHHLVLLGEEAP